MNILDFIKSYGGALAMLSSFATALIATRFVTRGDHAAHVTAIDGRLKDLFDKLDKVEDRVDRIENNLGHLPDKEITHRLEMAVERLGARMELLDERIKPVASMATRMQDFLMTRSDAA